MKVLGLNRVRLALVAVLALLAAFALVLTNGVSPTAAATTCTGEVLIGHTAPDNSFNNLSTTQWVATVFTASETFDVTAARLRTTNPDTGNTNVELRNVVSGEPGNTVLASFSGVATHEPYDWYCHEFAASYEVQQGVQYAIVVYQGTQDTYALYWRADNTASDPDSANFKSTDSGSTWTAQTCCDSIFEVYGNAAPPPTPTPTPTPTATPTPPPPTPTPDYAPVLWHDDVNNVTCWILTGKNPNGVRTSAGVSCIPDSQL